jgi:phosphatidylinositol glycan class K
MSADLPWAVVVSTSQYFQNYRHASNAMSIHSVVRSMGVPEDHILLMLAGNIPCDMRNAASGSIYNAVSRSSDLYPSGVQPDYRGDEVTGEALLGLLADRLPLGTPASRRLRSGPSSLVLLYLTGHGGDGFLKFNDHLEMASADLANAVRDMFAQRRCSELLIIMDTCQAATLGYQLDTQGPSDGVPGGQAMRAVSIASSDLGENSFSLDIDRFLGVAISDRFTHYLHRFLHGSPPDAQLAQLVSYMRKAPLRSSVVQQVHGSWNDTHVEGLRVRAFFGAARLVPGQLSSAAGDMVSVVPGSAGSAGPMPPQGVATTASASGWRRAEARAFELAHGHGGSALGEHAALEFGGAWPIAGWWLVDGTSHIALVIGWAALLFVVLLFRRTLREEHM